MLTKDALDEIANHGCGNPDCSHEHDDGIFFLHGRCHLDGRIEVSYRAGSGVLRVGCVECGKVIAQVAVAESS